MADTTGGTTHATGSAAPPGRTSRDKAVRGNEVPADAVPRDLLRAPEGELRRFARVKQAGPKGPRPGLRPRLAREW